MKSPATMMEVAKAAGVSKATVSNVFNHPEAVSAALAKQVLAAARAIGYAGPDARGRLLSSGKVHAIGVIPPGACGISGVFENPYTRQFLSGVANMCETHNVSLSLIDGRDGHAARGIANAVVDGFILHTTEHAKLIGPMSNRVPIVAVGFDAGPDISSLQFENHLAARQAAQYLIGLGHSRMAIVSSRFEAGPPIFHKPQQSPRKLVSPFPVFAEARLEGIAEALVAAGLSINDVPILEISEVPSQKATNQGAASMIFDYVPNVTAIIAFDDSLALYVLDEARHRNIAVPRQISIISFNDSPEAAAAIPPISVMAQPVYETGQAAARILFEGDVQHLKFSFDLKVRGSTVPPEQQ